MYEGMECDLLKKYGSYQKDELTFSILGAAFEVHRELGPGLLESVYGDALEIEFGSRPIPYEREKRINIYYKEQSLKTAYFADFLCYGEVIVELKAVEHLPSLHEAQLIHYLKATRLRRGLLLNFNSMKLEYKRLVNHY